MHKETFPGWYAFVVNTAVDHRFALFHVHKTVGTLKLLDGAKLELPTTPQQTFNQKSRIFELRGAFDEDGDTFELRCFALCCQVLLKCCLRLDFTGRYLAAPRP